MPLMKENHLGPRSISWYLVCQCTNFQINQIWSWLEKSTKNLLSTLIQYCRSLCCRTSRFSSKWFLIKLKVLYYCFLRLIGFWRLWWWRYYGKVFGACWKFLIAFFRRAKISNQRDSGFVKKSNLGWQLRAKECLMRWKIFLPILCLYKLVNAPRLHSYG